MKLKSFLTVLSLSSFAISFAAVNYTVKGELPADMEGKTIYIHDYDKRVNIDSAKVVNGKFSASGTYDHPILVRVENGNYFSNCILDSVVTVDFNTHQPAEGSELNRKYIEYYAALNAIQDELIRFREELASHGFEQPQLGEIFKLLWDKKNPLTLEIMENALKNEDNGIGYTALMNYSSLQTKVTPEKWDAIKDSIPAWLKSTRLYADRDMEFTNQKITAVGQPFVDFNATTPDGKEVKLSDYVGKGKYVLVDFWASWCGPCRKEARDVLKPLYEQLKDNDKFEILGVGVWDQPDRLKAAIEEDGNEWPQIFANGMEPMDLYGFDFVPMIIFFAPDGTILNRTLRGNTVTPTVTTALSE